MSPEQRIALGLSNLEKRKRLPSGLLNEMREALERARVVAVLDGWAQYRGPAGRGGQWYVVQDTVCVLHVLPPGAESELPPHYFDGPTPDMARAAAARAIEAGEV